MATLTLRKTAGGSTVRGGDTLRNGAVAPPVATTARQAAHLARMRRA